MRMDNLRHW